MKFTYRIDQKEYQLDLEKTDAGFILRLGDDEHILEDVHADACRLRFNLDDEIHTARWADQDAGTRWLALDGRSYHIEKATRVRRRGSDAAGQGLAMEASITSRPKLAVSLSLIRSALAGAPAPKSAPAGVPSAPIIVFMCPFYRPKRPSYRGSVM